MKETLCLTPTTENPDWDDWLLTLDTEIKESGYKKYHQNLQREDFSYFKTFYKGEEKIYQIGVLVYDFRKYMHFNPSANYIGIQYECMLIGDNRIDMSVCNPISLATFEEMALAFYERMNKYL